jgi:hypothetical protein
LRPVSPQTRFSPFQATQSFELYAAFDPLASKNKAMNGVNKLLKWCKKEENSLFILSAPTF